VTYRRLFVELFVTDVDRAARVFEDLGFVRGVAHVEPDGLDFVIMENGSIEVNLHWMLRRPEQQKLEKTIRLYFEPESLTELHGWLKAKGYDATDIEDSGYGAKVFHMTGPDGYEFWFQQFE
jgi:hypothetical protein